LKTLDLYILKKFLTTFVFVVGMLMLVIVVIDITERNDKFIRHGLTFSEILPYYLAFIPYMANLITPITVFIATVFVTSKLASHSEIIAALSSGVSFRRLMVPYVVGAVIIGALNYYLNGWVIPEANKVRIAFQVQYFQKPFYFTETDIHIKVAPESYAYLKNYNSNINAGFNFTLERITDNQLVHKLTAKRIEWDSANANWKLKEWRMRILEDDGEIIDFGKELDTLINLNPRDFESTYGYHETLTNKELKDFIALLRSRGDDGIRFYENEQHIRNMSPFAALILTFIGVIVSARKSRGGSGFQIAFGFFLAFIYIILFILSRAIADAGTVNAVLAVWLPNIAFSLVGLFMYHTVPR